MPTPLDYRSPQTRNLKLRTIHDHLLLREQAMLAKIAVLFLLGLPATFVGPWLIAAVCYTVSWRLGWHVSDALFFCIASAIVIPLLFRLELGTHGRYFDDALTGSGGASSSSWQSMNTWNALAGFYGDPEVVASGLTEISLWGPRQILDAIGKTRMVRRMKRVNRFQVEEAVTILLASDQALDIKSLGLPEQDKADLLSAMGYLLVYDWIGASKDGQRVWLTSDSRKKLPS
jgi:hypothetical protein